jgi:hypothetical protein
VLVLANLTGDTLMISGDDVWQSLEESLLNVKHKIFLSLSMAGICKYF